MAVTAESLIRKGRWSVSHFPEVADQKDLTRMFNELLKDAREETADIPDSSEYKDRVVTAYVKYLVYLQLVNDQTTTAASQSQPEYSRNFLQSQIDDLIEQRDRAFAEFTGLMAQAKPDSIAANIREMERV